MLNQYDKIARHYDFLSRLVFLKAQVNAQVQQLKHLPKNSTILVVGGGTGWILDEITKVHPNGLHIVYVEASEKMTALSKSRNFEQNTIEFYNISVQYFTFGLCFDVILTPFLFDNFTDEDSALAFQKLHGFLKNNGLWFFTDFNTDGKNSWWKRWLLKLTYKFFTTFKIIETNQLVNMAPYFEKHHYKIIDRKLYYGTFIEATVYQK
jgi:ubiquinone/menaquinone biosynthesis C-methylase UbiE